MQIKTRVTDFLLYRWRYIIGYGILAVAFTGLLILAGSSVPGGLTSSEQASAIASDSLAFNEWDPMSLVDIPYHLLQKFSLDLLGMSNLSIKLPSLLIAALSGIGLMALLRLWFKSNVAVITSAVVITTGHFLFVAQSGTSQILLIAVGVYIMLFSILITRRSKAALLWQILLAISIGVGLYIPFTIYIVIALISAALLHPHLRYLLKHTPAPHLLLLSLSTIIIASPLIIGISQEPTLALKLLGFPDGQVDWTNNLMSLYNQLFNVTRPESSTIMTPLYGLGSWLLIALGVYRLITAHYTARTYMVSVWLIIMIPVLVINPSITTITFVPFMLLIGFGIEFLVKFWYGLFPRNPYARVAGLLPLGVLIIGITYTGIQRYVYGFMYSPDLASNYSYDLKLVNKIADKERTPITLVVDKSERPFYDIVASHNDDITISGDSNQPSHYKGLVVYTHDAKRNIQPQEVPVGVATSSLQHNSDRFYLYRLNEK